MIMFSDTALYSSLEIGQSKYVLVNKYMKSLKVMIEHMSKGVC